LRRICGSSAGTARPTVTSAPKKLTAQLATFVQRQENRQNIRSQFRIEFTVPGLAAICEIAATSGSPLSGLAGV
jgi:hypothetical protein